MKQNYTRDQIEDMKYSIWAYLYGCEWNIDNLTDKEVIDCYEVAFVGRREGCAL